ncbi:MAG: MFS transporter [Calditrichaeota bacterium]|nr:MFS transporter [Calditrichota bacterium]
MNKIIYIFPMIIDMVLGVIFFAGPMRAIQNHESLKMISLLLTAYGIGYVIFSLLMSKIVKVRLAKAQVVGAAFIVSILCLILSFSESIKISLLVFSILPFGMSMFFNSFQAFMKDVDSGEAKPLTYSTSMYFFAVSIGFALGPFISGWMREVLPWKSVFLFAAAMAMIAAIGAFLFKPAHSSREIAANTQFADKPDLAISGWIGALTGTIILALFLTIYPKQCQAFGMRPGFRGMVIFLQSIVQAFVALSFIRSKNWMYSAKIWPLINLFGIASLLILFIAKTPLYLFVAAVALGFFAASYFFAAIFHALSHPSQSVRNIAINEASIGVGFFLGPQLVQLTPASSDFALPYLYAVPALAALIIFQYIFIKSKSR